MRPEELVLVVYEQGIRACRERNARKARRAVQLLINALDFDFEVAGNLLTLYDWVYRLLREGRYDEAATALEDMRGTWAAAIESERSRRAAAQASGESGLPKDLAG
jgi:flagellin-specific chaperone FliS